MPSYVNVLTVSSLVALVVAHSSSNGTSLDWPSRNHAKDLLLKRSRDCGTFTMYCGGLPKVGSDTRNKPVPMACANACAYINLFDKEFSAVYRDSTDNERNRFQSGCRKAAGTSRGQSVCNIAPFSQQFNDLLDKDEDPPEYSCDEFPMAEMSQPDFGPNNAPRNTLRCIDKTQNSGWYGQDESLNGGRRNECSGRLKDGDTYKIAFNYDGINDSDKKKLPFCLDDSGNPLMPEILWDSRSEFYLTQLPSSKGKIDFPYDPANDNTYANALTNTDVLQCLVEVVRTGDANFQATITYGDRSAAQKSAKLSSDGDSFTVDPPAGNQYKPLKITRTKPLGTGNGTPVEIVYAPGNLIFDFPWQSNTIGADNTLNIVRPDNVPSDSEGRYCLWTQVDEKSNEQTITCYFPCIKPVAEFG